MFFSVVGCWEHDWVEQAKKLQEVYEEYGNVEKENVELLVAKFNIKVVNCSFLNPASNDYLTLSILA